MNKNINILFIGAGIIVAIGLLWSAANFLNIKIGGSSQESNNVPVKFDTAAWESDRQSLAAMESEVLTINQNNAMFVEIDQVSDSVSGASDLALDEKSLGEEAQSADISGDINMLDNGTVESEIDQSINDVVQN